MLQANISYVILYSYPYTSDGLKAHNPQCLRKHGKLQGSCTHTLKFPVPATLGTVFCGQGYGWPKNTLGLPVQNTTCTVLYPDAP